MVGAGAGGGGVASPLVGRLEELAAVEQVLFRPGHGARVAIVQGEAGIGKSRFLDELIARSRRRAALVVRTTCEDLRMNLAPVRRLARQLLGDAARELFAPLASGADELQRDLALVSLAEEMTATLRRTLTLVVVDDIHWLDALSAKVLELVIGQLDEDGEPATVAFALAHRPFHGLDAASHAASHLVDRLARRQATRLSVLTGLDDAQVAELVALLAGDRPAVGVVDRVAQTSRGNPLHVQALVRSLPRHRVGHGAGPAALDAIATMGLPSVLVDAVSVWLDALSGPCAELLAAVAQMGQRFTLDDAVALSQEPVEVVGSLLAEAATSGTIVSEATRYRFVHALVREASAERLAAHLAGEIQRRAAGRLMHAAWLEGPERACAAGELLARLPAGDLVDGELDLLAAAGRAASELARWPDAGRFLELVLERRPDDRELRWVAAQAHEANADRAQALRRYLQVVDAARAAGDEGRWAEAASAYVRTELVCGDDSFGLPPGLPLLQECARAITDRRGQSMVLELVAEVENNRGRFELALRAGGRALALAEEVGDHELAARARFALGLAQSTGLDVAEAAETYRRGLADLDVADNPVIRTKIVTRLPFLQLAEGNLSAADEGAALAQQTAWARRDYADHGLASAVRAAVALLRGDLLGAEIHGRRAVSDLHRSNYTIGALFTFPTLLAVQLLEDDLPAAESVLAEWLGFSPAGSRRYRELLACTSAGAGVDVGPHRPYRRPLLQISAAGILVEAEVAARCRDGAHQAAILPFVEEVAASELVTAPAWPVLPWRVLGDLRRVVGDDDEARSAYREAVRQGRAIGAHGEVGRALHGLGLLGGTDGPAALGEAVRIYRRLGMSALEREALLADDVAEARPPGPEGRRFILVTDLSGSTPYAATKGDQAYYDAVRAHNEVVRHALARHGGHEFSEAGDGLYAWFSSADAATAAAATIRDVYASEWPDLPPITVAIAGGQPYFADGRPFGATVNLAARLSSLAEAGQILLDRTASESLAAPVPARSLGTRPIKGFTAPQELLLLER